MGDSNQFEVPLLPPSRETMGPPLGRKSAPSLVSSQVGVWGGQEVWGQGGFLEAVWLGAGSRRTVAQLPTNRFAKSLVWFSMAVLQPGQLGSLAWRSLGGGVSNPASVSPFRPEHP